MDRLLTYFNSDIYQTKSLKLLIIKNPNDSLSQKDYGDLMNEHGDNMNTKKIHMLRKRGKLPTETTLFGGQLVLKTIVNLVVGSRREANYPDEFWQGDHTLLDIVLMNERDKKNGHS